jgi:hypothetical protein
MATKSKPKATKRDDVVVVRVTSGIYHDDVWRPTGDHVEMSLKDARDLVALNMARIVAPEPAQ